MVYTVLFLSKDWGWKTYLFEIGQTDPVYMKFVITDGDVSRLRSMVDSSNNGSK